MRSALVILAVILAGCAAQTPAVPRTAAQHAANIAAAEQAGYKVVSSVDQTLFCPNASPTGSHMVASCITETQFERLLGAPNVVTPDTHFTKQSPSPGTSTGH